MTPIDELLFGDGDITPRQAKIRKRILFAFWVALWCLGVWRQYHGSPK